MDGAELIPVNPRQPQLIKTKRLSRLTLGEIAFVQRIFDGESATDAYLGSLAMSRKTDRRTAEAAASRVLQRVHVREYMREVEESAKAVIRTTVARITEGVEAIAMADRTAAFTDKGKIKPFSEWPRSLRMALDGIKVKEFFKTNAAGRRVCVRREFELKPGGAKLRALELLMQLKKMITVDDHSGPAADTSIRVITQNGRPSAEPPAPPAETPK